MEMTAVIEGLRSIAVPSKVEVVTDSAYVLRAMRDRWYERWIEEGQQRPNMDLWYQLIGLAQFHDITWIKVKGHRGDYWNERADRLADNARRNKLAMVVHTRGYEDTRCDDIAPSGRQCKLHLGHGGSHHWTEGKANGVAVYGEL
jgi:ribonuclease HI